MTILEADERVQRLLLLLLLLKLERWWKQKWRKSLDQECWRH
jgi:hypothetical protein